MTVCYPGGQITFLSKIDHKNPNSTKISHLLLKKMIKNQFFCKILCPYLKTNLIIYFSSWKYSEQKIILIVGNT